MQLGKLPLEIMVPVQNSPEQTSQPTANVSNGEGPLNTAPSTAASAGNRESFADRKAKVTRAAALSTETGMPVETVNVFGLPLAVVTGDETLVAIANKIASGEPGYFITANLHYARLTSLHEDLPSLNSAADFVVADGMPLVWYSHWCGTPLPERVTGSDMIYRISEQAAELGHQIFFLGGAPGVADEAASKLCELNPNLQIAGVETPPFRPLSEEENTQLIGRIRDANTDILFVALGQPKGERWIADNLQELAIPVCVQLGASFDFVAGRIKRAPKFYQRTGLEWAYRLFKEPKRMFPRYGGDAWFLLKCMASDVWGKIFGTKTVIRGAKGRATVSSAGSNKSTGREKQA